MRPFVEPDISVLEEEGNDVLSELGAHLTEECMVLLVVPNDDYLGVVVEDVLLREALTDFVCSMPS